jgi:PAS domain S-box-containing protein
VEVSLSSFLRIYDWKVSRQIILLLFCALIPLLGKANSESIHHFPEELHDETKTVARIAILSFRHKDVTLARWQPLIDYLNAEIPHVRFEQYAFTNREMDEAVALGQVDFVFVQPSHYVVLTYSHGLSSPLATLVNNQDGEPVSMFGGVIFTRADRSDIQSLADLRGKTVATPDISGLGGFQMQAFELHKHGLRAFKDYKVIETDQPQDKVIEAVINGVADVGFVRTGLLEAMVASGALDSDMMKILESRNEQGFPFPTSTALYPEWPFTAMTHVDRDLARQVASALLSIPHDGDLAKKMRISGFTIPGDYRSIDHLLRELRLPPFDTPLDFTFSEVWKRWQSVWLTLIGVISSLLFLSVIILTARNHKLVVAQRQLQDSSKEIARLGLAVEQSPESIIITDLTGKIIYVNKAFEKSTGYRTDEILGLNPSKFKSTRTPKEVYKELWGALSTGRIWQGELINCRRDGTEFCESAIISPIKDADDQVFGYLAVKQDITERKENEAHIYRLAFFDSLTGLSNRSRLNEMIAHRLSRPERTNHSDALLLVNIDRFKLINDARGQQLGDALLIELGRHLSELTRDAGTVARMGADEYAILLPDLGLDEPETT